MDDQCQFLVLVIEETGGVAEALEPGLERDGYEILHARDAAQGLKMALAFKPEVVLCDLRLNGRVNGVGLARAILMAKDPPPPLLVAFSPGQNGRGREAAREAGFHAYLDEPLNLETLERRVERFFQPVDEELLEN